jgi:hypothetical protein
MSPAGSSIRFRFAGPSGSRSAQEMKNNGDDCENQKKMDEKSRCVKRQEASQPKNDQHNSDSQEHGIFSSENFSIEGAINAAPLACQ